MKINRHWGSFTTRNSCVAKKLGAVYLTALQDQSHLNLLQCGGHIERRAVHQSQPRMQAIKFFDKFLHQTSKEAVVFTLSTLSPVSPNIVFISIFPTV